MIKMELMIEKTLRRLKKGEIFELQGDDYNYEALRYSKGKWYYTYQNCFSDTCNCVSHDRFITEIVSRKFVIEKVKEYIEYYLRYELKE